MSCTQNAQTNGPCPQMTFSASSNRITSAGFSYDAAGNLLSDGMSSYTWDAEGRVKSAVVNGVTTTYVYNALGERVQKTVGSTTTDTIYGAGGEPLAYVATNPFSTKEDLFYLGGRLLAIYVSGTRFLHANALGSTGVATNQYGAVTQDELYYPWGQSWKLAGTTDDERFAAMQARDAESGLDPTLFRHYNSSLARWLSPDPLGGDVTNPQSLNRYSYVLNDPCSLYDVLGLQGCDLSGPHPAQNLTSSSLMPAGPSGQPELYVTDIGQSISSASKDALGKLKSGAEYLWNGIEIGLAAYGIVQSGGAPLAIAAGGAGVISGGYNIANEATGNQHAVAAGSTSVASGALSIVSGVAEKNPVEVGAGAVSLVSGSCEVSKGLSNGSSGGAAGGAGRGPAPGAGEYAPPWWEQVWFENPGALFPSGTVTVTAQPACPRGYKWDSGVGMCVKQ